MILFGLDSFFIISFVSRSISLVKKREPVFIVGMPTFFFPQLTMFSARMPVRMMCQDEETNHHHPYRRPLSFPYPLKKDGRMIETSSKIEKKKKKNERKRQRLGPIASGDRVDHVKAQPLSMSAIAWQIIDFTVTNSAR